MKPSLAILGALAAAACTTPSAETASGAATPGEQLGLDTCSALPEGFDASALRSWHESGGDVILSPALPEPGQESFVLVKSLFPRYYGEQSAIARTTSNGWGAQEDLPLADVCPESTWPIWGASLGKHPDGTVIELATRQALPPSFEVREVWMNNRGQNFRVEYRHRASWIGATELRIVPNDWEPSRPREPDLVLAGQDLPVTTRTFPMGGTTAPTLHWSVDGGASGDVEMELVANGAGPYGNDSEWMGALPGDVVGAGAVVRAWVSATDATGAALEEKTDGGARRVLEIRPKRLEAQWGGGWGSFRPSSREYREGGLFHATGAERETTLGCNNHGASLSSYVERVARLWIPGVSDRAYPSEDAMRAHATLARAEVVTGSGQTLRARFVGKQGNDFVFGFLAFTDLCMGDGPLTEGDHDFRLRVSLDGGATYRTFGDGDDGASPLTLHFRRSCSYFDDPNDC